MIFSWSCVRADWRERVRKVIEQFLGDGGEFLLTGALPQQDRSLPPIVMAGSASFRC